jgi:hypothetical protein
LKHFVLPEKGFEIRDLLIAADFVGGVLFREAKRAKRGKKNKKGIFLLFLYLFCPFCFLKKDPSPVKERNHKIRSSQEI